MSPNGVVVVTSPASHLPSPSSSSTPAASSLSPITQLSQSTTTTTSMFATSTIGDKLSSSSTTTIPTSTTTATAASTIFASSAIGDKTAPFSTTKATPTSISTHSLQPPYSTTAAATSSSSPLSSSTTIASIATTAATVARTTTTIPIRNPRPPVSNQSPVTIFSVPPKQYKPDHLATIDLIIIVVYLCLLLSTSISTMIRTKKSLKRKAALAAAANGGTKMGAPSQNNFLASRKMNWFTVGASIFASNLGSEHFIGLSGSAAANGISVAAFEMNALIILQLATWIFLPVLIASKISTLPEYMSKRFGGKRIRAYLAILSILLYIFTKISVNLYSGGIFIQQAVGWNLYTSAMFILALTCVMTLTGGLKGAMMIDNLQAIVMTVGASIVSASALVAIGGWSGLKTKYAMAIPSKVPANLTHCAQPNPRAFQMLRPADDRDMPWIGFLIGQTPASVWYWAADQMMVQRFLSARSLAHVQGSAVFAGYLKILPLVFMIIPGMISRCLFTDEVGCIDPAECQRYCQSSVSCSNTAYPRLVLELMPLGARGMMVAAMVAALMQDLCNVFNSASALFSCDIWPLVRKFPSQKEQERAGRVFVICLVFASIMWIPVIQEMQGGQLFIYIQAVAAMFWPPICAVYICAIMWKRTNEAGAFWSLMIGFCLGVLRMAMSFMYKEPSCGQHVDDRPWLLKHVHYMYYAAFLFWATMACVVVISKLTRPPAPFRLIRTTFWTRFDTNIRKDDKNVFEMKYSGATTTSTTTTKGGDGKQLVETESDDRKLSVSPQPNNNGLANNYQHQQGGAGARLSEGDISMGESVMLGGSRSSQARLFTIDEQHEKKTADLSSVIVDINKAAEATSKELNKKMATGAGGGSGGQTAPVLGASQRQRPPGLPHQTSLTATATAAVGEAGKMLASKLGYTEANLRGARDMVLAAASHLTGGSGGGAPDSRIKFKNLQRDYFDDDEDDDDGDDDDDRRRSRNNQAESTMDDDDDEEEDLVDLPRKQQRLKRNRRSQSVLSAALSSYKQKQRGGYQKALDEDDEDEEEEDEDDDDDDDDVDDEKKTLNRSSSSRGKKRAGGGARDSNEVSSSTDDNKKSAPNHHGSSMPLVGKKGGGGGNSGSSHKRSSRQRSQRQRDRLIGANGVKRGASGKKFKSKAMKYEEEYDEDTESGRNYRCLDNSVSLLLKTPLEETILRIAVGAILLVSIGIFVLLSLPPAPVPKEIADILIKN